MFLIFYAEFATGLFVLLDIAPFRNNLIYINSSFRYTVVQSARYSNCAELRHRTNFARAPNADRARVRLDVKRICFFRYDLNFASLQTPKTKGISKFPENNKRRIFYILIIIASVKVFTTYSL